eukprot:PhF_6_TR474/c0_g1_i1/m.216
MGSACSTGKSFLTPMSPVMPVAAEAPEKSVGQQQDTTNDDSMSISAGWKVYACPFYRIQHPSSWVSVNKSTKSRFETSFVEDTTMKVSARVVIQPNSGGGNVVGCRGIEELEQSVHRYLGYVRSSQISLHDEIGIHYVTIFSGIRQEGILVSSPRGTISVYCQSHESLWGSRALQFQRFMFSLCW